MAAPTAATPARVNTRHDIPIAPSPWTLKATIYTFMFYTSPSQGLPSFAFSPLEANDAIFTSGKHCGGLASVQVIRYSESPVGPYDEMLLCPGAFKWERTDQGTRITGRNSRISRIYVSQKDTCYNGRLHWNIPKHLARFSFVSQPSGATKIEVFPHDTTGDALEGTASTKPFFKATYTPIQYMPYFSFSTRLAGYVGLDLNIVQPPLPRGKGKEGELPGTNRWCKILPLEYSKKASLGWWDLRQTDEVSKSTYSGVSGSEGEVYLDGTYSAFENWWPGLRRWMLGMKMEDATLEFGGEVYWE